MHGLYHQGCLVKSNATHCDELTIEGMLFLAPGGMRTRRSGLRAVHPQVHLWRGLGLHALVHTSGGHQKSWRVTVVSIAIS